MSPMKDGRRAPDDLAADFAERLDVLTSEQARVEAERCLYCYDAPCMVACPTSIDIPGFIQRIATGDRQGSATRILEANVLGASCARVCATDELCEEACVLDRAHEKPIEIGRLQRYATDKVVEEGQRIPYEAGPATGRSVGIVGGGPAALAAATGLRVHGHDVTIYERQPELGGLNRYGIIPLREPTEIARWEVEQVLGLGVTARTGTAVGEDVTTEELLADHDALFLAIGAGRNVADIGLEGSELEGVDDALEFIERIRVDEPETIPVGDHVVVVGAGNTAMDACTIAVRLGAETVTCVYRRTEAEMTGYQSEYEHCLQEGVRFRWLTQPVRAVAGDDGSVTGLACVDVTLGEPGPDGKARTTLGTDELVLACDHVLLATGQSRETSVPEQLGLELDGARVRTGADGFSTSHPRVFAGGDAVLTGKELSVVDAVAQGRDAAERIHEAVMSMHKAEA